MAGISFRLERYIKNCSMSEVVLRELTAMTESVGAWWLTILFLCLTGWLAGLTNTSAYYIVILTFATVFSMHFSSPVNNVLGKYLSDKIYLKQYHTVVTSLTGAFLVGILLSFGVSLLVVLFFSQIPFNHKIIFASLTASLTSLWITNNVMSILEQERIAFLTFALGFCLSSLFFLFKKITGQTGILVGITVGFAFITFAQFAFILKGFNRGRIYPEFSFLFNFKDYYREVLAGLFFTSGLWIDKIVFWLMPQTARKIDSFFRYSDYDLPFFIAFTIFSLSQFLILRTFKEDIRTPYQTFSQALQYNLPLFRLNEEKYKLITGYRKMLSTLTFVYGPFTLAILFAVSTGIIRLPWSNPFVFHYLTMGTFFLAIFSLNYIFLQYLNRYDLLVVICLLFALLNGCGTVLGIKKGPEYNGCAFFISSLVAAGISSYCVHKILGRWEYVIFKGVADDF